MNREETIRQLNTVPFSQIRWGVQPGDILPMASVLDFTGFRPVEKWWPCIRTREDHQEFGSCTCNATTGAGEVKIWEVRQEAVPLNYTALYWQCRDKFYGNRKDQGLQVWMPMAGGVEFGAFPDDASFEELPFSAGAICDALEQDGPVIFAQSLHEGWQPKALNPVNGAVDESQVKNVNPLANHAMECVAAVRVGGCDMFAMRQSWGPLGYQGQGIVLQTVMHALKTMCARPLRLKWGAKLATWDFSKWVEA